MVVKIAASEYHYYLNLGMVQSCTRCKFCQLQLVPTRNGDTQPESPENLISKDLISLFNSATTEFQAVTNNENKTMSHRHSAVAATPAPAPLRVPPGRGHGAEIDVDALDALSRSLPTGGAMLDPEPSEYAMLRPSRSNTAVLEAVTDEDEDGLAETEPLLRQRTASTARSTASGHSSPFLDNTSTGRFWFIFAQLLASQFIACFDGTIMASSHPVITSYFGAANSASWLSTAFLLTSTAFQPLLGRLSDAVGRKPLYVACLVVFLISTCWCALAGSIESFIMARAACGLGAGGSMTLGTIIVSDLVPIEYVLVDFIQFENADIRSDAEEPTNHISTSPTALAALSAPRWEVRSQKGWAGDGSLGFRSRRLL